MTVTQTSFNPTFQTSTGTQLVKETSDTSVANTSTTQTAKEEAEELQQQFLQILLTQLENQNPLEPVDTNEFTQQLVQYSSLEQQIDTNLKLDQMVEAIQLSSNLNAFSYLNNRAELDSDMSVMQDGVADWSYAMEGGANTVEIKVKDSSGRTVYEETLSNQSAGTYDFSFNAADAEFDVADGDVLTLSVTATTRDGETFPVDIKTEVVIDGVETNEDGIVLRAGGLTFEPSDIEKILGPATTA